MQETRSYIKRDTCHLKQGNRIFKCEIDSYFNVSQMLLLKINTIYIPYGKPYQVELTPQQIY